MVRDVGTWRALIDEYARLERLEGSTPQRRGQRFNGMIAELLEHWGVPASANSRSKGEIDVGFTHDGIRYVLEAKWEKTKADTGDLAKLHKRVQQRLSGTRGVFLAMAGYTPEAIADISDGQRLEILLLDRSHWEAMLSGLVPPTELLTLAGDHAAFHGEAFAPLTALLARSARLPKVEFDASPPYMPVVDVSAVRGEAKFTLSVVSPDQLGVTCIGTDELLLTTSTGIVRANVAKKTVAAAVEVAHCHRRTVLQPDGSILFTRRLGVGRFHRGEITSIAGGAVGATCLVEAPDGTTWLLDNGDQSGQAPASISQIGSRLAEQTRYELDYPSATATNAAWISASHLLVAGAAGFQTTTLVEASTPLQPPSQANPMGLLHVSGRVVLTAGDGITVAATDLTNGASTELARLAMRGSISELTKAKTGAIYLAAYDQTPNQKTYTVVRLDLAVPDNLETATRAAASVTEIEATAPLTTAPAGSAALQEITASRTAGRHEQDGTPSAFDQSVAVLAAERLREHEHGFHDAVRFAPSLGWPALSALAARGFDLKGWLEGWRNGRLDVEMGRAPAEAEAASWLPALADLLGSYVDVFGFEHWSFTPSSAYVEGFVTGLRAVWDSAANATEAVISPSFILSEPVAAPEIHAPRRASRSAPNARQELRTPTASDQTPPSASQPPSNVSPDGRPTPLFVTVKGILGSINFDGETVTVRKEGYGPRMKGVQVLPVGKIEKIIVKPATAMFHGYIQFVTRDHPPASDGRFGAAAGRPHREDPDSISYQKRANSEIENLRKQIEDAIASTNDL